MDMIGVRDSNNNATWHDHNKYAALENWGKKLWKSITSVKCYCRCFLHDTMPHNVGAEA